MSMLSLTLCFCLAGCHLSLAGWCVFWLAGALLGWLEALPGWLDSLLSWLESLPGRAEIFFWLADVSSLLARVFSYRGGFACWSFLLAGGGFFLAGWSPSRLSGALPGWIEC